MLYELSEIYVAPGFTQPSQKTRGHVAQWLAQTECFGVVQVAEKTLTATESGAVTIDYWGVHGGLPTGIEAHVLIDSEGCKALEGVGGRGTELSKTEFTCDDLLGLLSNRP